MATPTKRIVADLRDRIDWLRAVSKRNLATPLEPHEALRLWKLLREAADRLEYQDEALADPDSMRRP